MLDFRFSSSILILYDFLNILAVWGCGEMKCGLFSLDWPLQWLLWIVRYVGKKKREGLHMSAWFDLNHVPLLSILGLDNQFRFRVL